MRYGTAYLDSFVQETPVFPSGGRCGGVIPLEPMNYYGGPAFGTSEYGGSLTLNEAGIYAVSMQTGLLAANPVDTDVHVLLGYDTPNAGGIATTPIVYDKRTVIGGGFRELFVPLSGLIVVGGGGVHPAPLRIHAIGVMMTSEPDGSGTASLAYHQGWDYGWPDLGVALRIAKLEDGSAIPPMPPPAAGAIATGAGQSAVVRR